MRAGASCDLLCGSLMASGAKHSVLHSLARRVSSLANNLNISSVLYWVVDFLIKFSEFFVNSGHKSFTNLCFINISPRL